VRLAASFDYSFLVLRMIGTVGGATPRKKIALALI
jgi:hypothetical protein